MGLSNGLQDAHPHPWPLRLSLQVILFPLMHGSSSLIAFFWEVQWIVCQCSFFLSTKTPEEDKRRRRGQTGKGQQKEYGL